MADAAIKGAVWKDGRLLGEVVSIDATVNFEHVDVPRLADVGRTRSGAFVIKNVSNLMKEIVMTKVQAPANPYRNGAADSAGRFMEMNDELSGIRPRRTDDPRFGGPGLNAQDLDRMVRQHFRDGHAVAEREGEAKLAELRATLPDVFDEGYVAGRLERARGVAGDFRAFLIEIGATLRAVEEAPKSKRDEVLPDLRTALDEAMEFAAAMVSLDPAAAARALATDEHVRHG